MSNSTLEMQLNLVLGWVSEAGANITMFNSYEGVDAPDGNNYIQLDSSVETNDEGLYQMVPTIQGHVYVLSFWMRARDPAAADSDDQALIVSSHYTIKMQSL